MKDDDDKPNGESNALAKLSATQLAEFDALADAATALVAGHPRGGGDLLLRMEKITGVWVFGQASTQVQPGSEWALNPMACGHGYIAWARPPAPTKKLGEVMVAITKPKPDPASLPDVAAGGGDWSEQISLTFQCLNGEDRDMVVAYKSNAMGGIERAIELIGKVGQRARDRNPAIVPIVELQHDSYQHPSYGKVCKPIFFIKRWTTMNDPGGGGVDKQPNVDGPKPAAAAAQPARQPRAPVADSVAAETPRPGEPVRRRRGAAAPA